MDDFIISEEGKPLGSGSFGIVKKAIHKMTGKIYAVKIVQKSLNPGITNQQHELTIDAASLPININPLPAESSTYNKTVGSTGIK